MLLFVSDCNIELRSSCTNGFVRIYIRVAYLRNEIHRIRTMDDTRVYVLRSVQLIINTFIDDEIVRNFFFFIFASIPHITSHSLASPLRTSTHFSIAHLFPDFPPHPDYPYLLDYPVNIPSFYMSLIPSSPILF